MRFANAPSHFDHRPRGTRSAVALRDACKIKKMAAPCVAQARG